jgi:hypothetical protein
MARILAGKRVCGFDMGSLVFAGFYIMTAMGGMGDEVRGRTKIETWLRFKRENRSDEPPYEMTLDWPRNKKETYEMMQKDADTGEWVLRYHFSK